MTDLDRLEQKNADRIKSLQKDLTLAMREGKAKKEISKIEAKIEKAKQEEGRLAYTRQEREK